MPRGTDMIGETFDQLKTGDSDRFSKAVTDADVYLFAGISGDLNPAHIDETYAQGTSLQDTHRPRHAFGGLISAVIGMRLPGPGTVYMHQTLDFLAPVYIGDTVTAKVEVIEKMEEKKQVRLKTTCVNQEGKKVLDGEALVSPPRSPKTA